MLLPIILPPTLLLTHLDIETQALLAPPAVRSLAWLYVQCLAVYMPCRSPGPGSGRGRPHYPGLSTVRASRKGVQKPVQAGVTSSAQSRRAPAFMTSRRGNVNLNKEPFEGYVRRWKRTLVPCGDKGGTNNNTLGSSGGGGGGNKKLLMFKWVQTGTIQPTRAQRLRRSYACPLHREGP